MTFISLLCSAAAVSL